MQITGNNFSVKNGGDACEGNRTVRNSLSLPSKRPCLECARDNMSVLKNGITLYLEPQNEAVGYL